MRCIVRMNRRQYRTNVVVVKSIDPKFLVLRCCILLWYSFGVFAFLMDNAAVREHERIFLVINLADRDPASTCCETAQHRRKQERTIVSVVRFEVQF